MEELQKVGVRLKLAGEGESARHRCSHADDLLEALNRKLVRPSEGEAIAGCCFFELVGGDLVGL